MIKIIACIGKNNELGKDNALLWHIKEDMQFFKEKTTNQVVIMGRKTLESLPGGNPLPDRTNLVLSRDMQYKDGVKIYRSVGAITRDFYKEDLYVIGGASIYREFINMADELILTEVDKEDPNADVFFPSFDKTQYDIEQIGDFSNENPPYKRFVYRKK